MTWSWYASQATCLLLQSVMSHMSPKADSCMLCVCQCPEASEYLQVLAMDMLLDTSAQPGSNEASGRHGVQSSAVSAQMEPIAEHALTEQEGKGPAGAVER